MDDSDLDAAVGAGVLDAETRERLRAFLRDRQTITASPDEESFRLVTSFNDIFVSIACGLVFVAIGVLGVLEGGRGGSGTDLAAAFAAAVAWAMAEYFTRRQRMALPSILLLLVFVGAAACFGMWETSALLGPEASADHPGVRFALAGVFGLGAAIAHWRRFHVPITIAAGTAGACMVILSLFGGTGSRLATIGLLGLAVFAEAMWFDMRDRLRTTRRADIAFWLHLLAAPMIVHPLLSPTGLLGSGDTSVSGGGVTLAVFAVLTWIALVIDRRALMVSSLVYVIVALNTVISSGEKTSMTFGVTALAIGVFLVLLAGLWKTLRFAIVSRMPAGVVRREPEIRWAV